MSRAHAAGRRRLLGLSGAAILSRPASMLALPALATGAMPRRASAAVSQSLSRLPPAVTAQAGELRRLGVGTMRWFGLHVYDAALWVRDATWDPADTFVLDIVYARDIAGKALADSSITEMKRVGFTDEAQHARWLPAMVRTFPDVGRGDRLVGLNLKGAGAAFFNQDRALGTIDDPLFARAFFAIWLDPRTREPQLRNRLLGKV
ncbi:MAG: chalcone isomerase family protein [bacterium]|nr:chalcone isomerase family protein [Betaproteobacteria bacterium]